MRFQAQGKLAPDGGRAALCQPTHQSAASNREAGHSEEVPALSAYLAGTAALGFESAAGSRGLLTRNSLPALEASARAQRQDQVQTQQAALTDTAPRGNTSELADFESVCQSEARRCAKQREDSAKSCCSQIVISPV